MVCAVSTTRDACSAHCVLGNHQSVLQAPLDILCADPTKVINTSETDLDAEPTYGEVTVAG